MIDEDNLRRALQRPWVSFGSDAQSMAPEGVFLRSRRTRGRMAASRGCWVATCATKVVPLEEAVRRLSRQPAENLGLDRRGSLQPGFYADVVVFDPATIQDRATYEQPHQYATGVEHVFVNGVQVLRNGSHTDATPGRALWGPGVYVASPRQ